MVYSITAPVPGQPVSKAQFGDPVIAALNDLDSRVAAITGARIDKTKTANETRVSTTTYALDADLKDIPLSIGTWEIMLRVLCIGGAGGIAVKTQWAFTGTWNNPFRMIQGPNPGNTADPLTGTVAMRSSVAATNADAIWGLGTSGNYHYWTEYSKKIIVTAPGLMGLNWAPNVSSATSGGVRQDSTITCIKVA